MDGRDTLPCQSRLQGVRPGGGEGVSPGASRSSALRWTAPSRQRRVWLVTYGPPEFDPSQFLRPSDLSGRPNEAYNRDLHQGLDGVVAAKRERDAAESERRREDLAHNDEQIAIGREQVRIASDALGLSNRQAELAEGQGRTARLTLWIAAAALLVGIAAIVAAVVIAP